jgi:leucyl/phenylalanyl-tRNA--protein transferase
MPDGLLALGGDLSPARLLEAYRRGIFPWFSEEDPPLWWCPDPRCVLYPDRIRVSHSMKPLLKRGAFQFRVNTDFEGVMRGCQHVPRPGQDGTWITEEIIESYTALHRMGVAHSAEAWLDGKLVGGLYGLRIGKVFFGESMFSTVSNSSKWVFIKWVEKMKEEGVMLIDCQVETAHLLSMGAELIPRRRFLGHLNAWIEA